MGIARRQPYRSRRGDARLLDAILGTLRRGGFPLDEALHAIHLLGSRMLGFTQDLFDDSGESTPEETAALVEQIGDAFPHVAELALAATHDGPLGGCDDDLEFELGLDLILEGLERRRDAALQARS